MSSKSCCCGKLSAHRKGNLFVISAPSGAGKDTVINKVLELRPETHLSVSATTRPPRAGEVCGLSYYFVAHERFKKMIANGEFLEYAEYVGQYYGTLKKPVNELIESGRDVILEIEVKGAKQIMSIMPRAVTIFIVPPSYEELERRLRGRGTENEEKLAERLEVARIELDEKRHYKHIVVNDTVLRAAEEISKIIDANKH